MTATPMLLTPFSAPVQAALASGGAWFETGARVGVGASVGAGAWLAVFAHAAAPVAVAALWQGAAIALVLGLCLKCAERMRIHIGAAERFAVWAAAFAAVAALPLLPSLLPLLVRGAAWGSAAGAPGNLQIGAQMGTSAHAPWFQLPHFEIDEHWALAIAAVWLIASLVRAASLAAHSLRLRRLWLAAEPVEMAADCAGDDVNLRAFLAAASGARRPGTICTTRELDRPSVIGFFAPRILIPDWLWVKLTPGELEQVVLHEAEHLSRRDDWTNLLQKVALVLFPLNPALAWIEQRLCREREMACDEGVVRRTQAPRAYAACLASLAERGLERRFDLQMERSRAHALSLGAFDRRPELVRRVSSLLARRPALHPVAARVLAGVAACGLLIASVELARCPQMVAFVSAAPVRVAQNQPARMNVAQVDLLAPQDGDRVFAEPSVAPDDSGFRAVRTKAILPPKLSPGMPAALALRETAAKSDDASQRERASAETAPRAVLLKTEMPDADFAASQPGVVVFTAWEEVETLPRRGVPVADYDVDDSTGPNSGASENDSENRAASQTPTRPSIQITVTRLIFFVAPRPSTNTVNAPVPGSNTPRPRASDSRRPSAPAPESGWLFFDL
jgi:beta-lactamase regulating signal transducer with metallopeptidase domain